MIEDLKQVRDALEALLNYQQADMDGVMVLTSRQAIHEVSDYVRATLDRIIADENSHTFTEGNIRGQDKGKIKIGSITKPVNPPPAPTPAQPEKLDVEKLYRHSCNCEGDNGTCSECSYDWGWNDCIEHISSTYDFVTKEQK